MIKNTTCPFCQQIVCRGKDGKGVKGSEWVKGKDKVKQWFHTDCFDKGAKRVDTRSNSDIYTDTMSRGERGNR